MKTFAQYDISTGQIIGFYKEGIHAEIPSNSIEITHAQWLDCCAYQSKYQVNPMTLQLELATKKENKSIAKKFIHAILSAVR